MKTVSLHTRLLFATLIPVTLFVLLFGFLTVMLRFQDIDDLQDRHAEVLLEKYRTLAEGAPDRSHWDALAQASLENNTLQSLSILDAGFRTVSHAGPNLRAPLRGLPVKPVMQTASGPDGEQYLQAVTPFRFQGQGYWLVVELRPSRFTIARYQSVIVTTMSAFILLLVLAVVLSTSLRRWLDPIVGMRKQIKQLSPDNLEQRLACPADGDLAELQDDINALLDRIAAGVAELRQDIEQTRADLEENYQTIEAQNIELRLSRAQAIEGNRIKSAFLANISHELRTPLNSINGFSRLLLKSPLQGRQADFVETIQKSANNLLAIINDVLDFSKIEAGKLQLERQPFAIEDAVFDVLNMLSPQADDKGLEQVAFIYDDVPPVIVGDVLRFKQVLTNLVSNAIKFTASGEVVVRVMLEDTRPLHHLIRISVTDTGIGLSRTAKADLFQAFQQGDPSVSRQFGGTGLGLVIAKNLVGLMEGQIGFDEDQEVGATFWFDFKAGIAEARPTEAIRLTGKSVRVLEAHEKCRQLMVGTLDRAGARVEAVDSLDGLQRMMAEQPCDAVILGSNALGTDRDGLVRLRAVFDGPIIVLTRGYDTQPDARQVEQMRLLCLSRPLRPKQLLLLTAQAFSLLRLQGNPRTDSRDQPPARPVPLRILAVDDHPANLKLVCTLLRDLGIETVGVDNGPDAVNLAVETGFDLIFMDIQMPGMSGIDATRAIREREREGRRVPIVALTAHALADEREHMLREGMNDYLTKPLQEEQLVHIIQKWTGVVVQGGEEYPVMPSGDDGRREAPSPVDWAESLQLAAGKKDLAQDMLVMLLDSLPAQREKMETAVRQGNAAALLAHAHYLHGATRYCGVPGLRAATGRLEERLKEVLHERPGTALQETAAEREALYDRMDELARWRGQVKSLTGPAA